MTEKNKKASHVVCPGCTLLCDDIEIQHSGGTINALNACEKGKQFFASPPGKNPTHHADGCSVELQTAINAAVKVLRRSKSPLIVGLDRLTTQAQQGAWKIADAVGATIDTAAANSGRGDMFALQSIGDVTATLGEIGNRSDLIFFLFCDPESTHPRLLERLGRSAEGLDRRIIVIDERETETAKLADDFQQIKRRDVPSLLAAVHATIAGLDLDSERVERSTGMSLATINSLAGSMTSAHYGALFHGPSADESAFDLSCDRLHRLVCELNNHTRFVAMKLRQDQNALSGENVLSWSCGYPFAVNQSRNFPRFHWLEYSAATVLERRECDTVLQFSGLGTGSTLDSLPGSRPHTIRVTPRISIGPDPDRSSDVAIQTRIEGLEQAGDYCRTDDVALPLSAVVNPHPDSISAEDCLHRILDGIQD